MQTVGQWMNNTEQRLESVRRSAVRSDVPSDPDSDYGILWNTQYFEPADGVDYAAGRAYLIGGSCVLTGMASYTTGPTITAGTRANVVMFVLPKGWAPESRYVLNCPMGASAPDLQTTVGTARLEVRDDGKVYYTGGTLSLAVGGWIALQGIFLCNVSVRD